MHKPKPPPKPKVIPKLKRNSPSKEPPKNFIVKITPIPLNELDTSSSYECSAMCVLSIDKKISVIFFASKIHTYSLLHLYWVQTIKNTVSTGSQVHEYTFNWF